MCGRTIKLIVKKIDAEEIYKDFVRIPEEYRGGIKEGRVCKLRVGKNKILRSVRGLIGESNNIIKMDEFTRARLGASNNRELTFTIRETWWIGQFLWAWNATDPTPRIAARLGIVSLALGVLGLMLGVLSLRDIFGKF